ncbi:unnamed protein product [Dovyalis caffra]|uniref:CSC1-like protein RXW8 n=1 Tax=Dovyalis caffra TaxID=77055 RepID=A0AAV1S799_9ROSI|nr:unnamed protein product [Dovyalis caffra]
MRNILQPKTATDAQQHKNHYIGLTEYKSITKMRLAHITTSPPNPSHFTILVRSIPYSLEESYSNSVKKFFTNYYASSYLSHQIVYRCGTVQKLMVDAERMCMRLKAVPKGRSSLKPCCLCGGSATSFKVLTDEPGNVKDGFSYSDLDLAPRDNERSAAFVFFKTRYAAVVATQMLQSPNPMSWVTELAPEPHDILWSNLCIPFRQLWLRKIATLLAAILFMVLFLAPVTFVQSLAQLEKLSKTFPFLRGFLKQDLIKHVVTGYLPSVILMLFLYTVPPTMMLFSSVEGPVSRGFLFAFNMLSSVRDLPAELAKALPNQLVLPGVLIFHASYGIVNLVFCVTDAMRGFIMYGKLLSNVPKMDPLIFVVLNVELKKQRFFPIFKNNVAQVLIEMDRRDEQSGQMEEIHQQLHSAYCQLTQFPLTSHEYRKSVHEVHEDKIQAPEGTKPGKEPSEVSEPCAVCNFGKEDSIVE